MNKVTKAANYHVTNEVAGMIDHDISTGDMTESFISGAVWLQKRMIKEIETRRGALLLEGYKSGSSAIITLNRLLDILKGINE